MSASPMRQIMSNKPIVKLTGHGGLLFTPVGREDNRLVFRQVDFQTGEPIKIEETPVKTKGGPTKTEETATEEKKTFVFKDVRVFQGMVCAASESALEEINDLLIS